MKSPSVDAFWMCSAFCAALVLAAGLLTILGANDRGVHASLAATARLGFLLFWPAYSGGALAALFGRRYQPLKQHAREFGLAFAAVLMVHLGLVSWLCLIGAAPAMSTFIVFGIAAVWVYLLALFSINFVRQALGSKYWRAVNTVGMNYVAYAFFIDFAKQPFHGGGRHIVVYAPFVVLSVTGPILRLAALCQRLGSERPWVNSVRSPYGKK